MKKEYQELKMRVLLLLPRDILALSENVDEDIFDPGDGEW